VRLQGKKAIVTGGAQGIGRGIAERFLQEGASVLLLDINRAKLAETAAELNQAYTGSAAYMVCDLSDPNQAREAAVRAWDQLGQVDILINNAGIAYREPFTDISFPVWKRVMEVNVDSMFVLSQFIAKRMIGHGIQGSIVNMASKNGLAGSSMLAHYNTSKGAVLLLTQSMAVELAAHGIRVNAVAPGFIESPLDQRLKLEDSSLELTARTPMRRLGTAEEVANAFLFLASDEASYITGTTLVVDGGHLANGSEL